MHLILDEEEAWSFMTLIVSQVLDQVELSDEGRDRIKQWRTHLQPGTPPLQELASALNAALGNTIDEELTRTIRRRDYYRKAR